MPKEMEIVTDFLWKFQKTTEKMERIWQMHTFLRRIWIC